ncbi:hypothetical protein PFMALIP_00003 [Plasmodium falciparum MaliPS096_E11]|uniref:Surface antigen n=1 Tax=Plasmodium falciparum MaliPS096_E11 TaxID=1036727 RepID=A0A024WY28_PLAFA|nr:hypothetical protein PFMALIP_00003 [Plasmodium falciparum MaliPS096_E11]
MKDHYINILLFALPLNILVYNQRNHYITPRHTETNRSLCECELYAPANYDSDPEMKRVMQQFEDRTTQRFHEYDERMKTTRQKCKEQCDKEIQKIVLKDKIDKELTEKFATLQTDIQSDSIPTCVCEKSMADKMEKGCLRCAGVLGGGVAPGVGLLGGIGQLGLDVWKAAAIKAAARYAASKGAAEGLAAGKIAGDAHGMKIVTEFLKAYSVDKFCPELFNSIGKTIPYNDVTKISEIILQKKSAMCHAGVPGNSICDKIAANFKLIPTPSYQAPPTKVAITNVVREHVDKATRSAKALADVEAANVSSKMTAQLTAQETNLINTTYTTYYTAIIASIVAIVVIVLIMVIIYLILRYRRKKKMKKKLQYIKLLEE